MPVFSDGEAPFLSLLVQPTLLMLYLIIMKRNEGDSIPIPTLSNTPQRLSARELILSTLQEWIINGTMQPGEKLNDTELAKYFSVSRTPVREAIQTLSDMGFVEIVPSCGTRVAPIDWSDIRECYEMIVYLQIIAAEVVIDHLKKSDFDKMRALNIAFEDAVLQQDATRQQAADADFHRYLIHKKENHYLHQCFDQFLHKVFRVENLYFKASVNRTTSIQQHEAIIQALESKDLDQLRSRLHDNWFDGYERLFHQQNADDLH